MTGERKQLAAKEKQKIREKLNQPQPDLKWLLVGAAPGMYGPSVPFYRHG